MKKIKGFKVLILMFILIMSLASCGSKIDPPETVVDKALTAIKERDFTTASTYFDKNLEDSLSILDGENSDSEEETYSQEVIAKLFGSIQYEIISSETQDTTAVVKANIKSIDMSAVISDYFSEAFSYIFSGLSEEELDAKFNEILLTSMDNNADNLTEIDVDINLVKGDSGWLITADDAFLDAITGGLNSVAQNLSNVG